MLIAKTQFSVAMVPLTTFTRMGSELITVIEDCHMLESFSLYDRQEPFDCTESASMKLADGAHFDAKLVRVVSQYGNDNIAQYNEVAEN